MQHKESNSKIQGALQKYTNETTLLACPLLKKLQLTDDSYIFTFGLPEPDITLGLEVGQHLAIHATLPTPFKPEGEEVRRKYTPTSPVDQKGTFDLVIKIYRRGENIHFPEGGVMTQYLDTLPIDDKIYISGPTGKLIYKGHGLFYMKKLKLEKSFEEVGFIAGGTGIAPMYQIMQAVIREKKDITKLHLLFANKTEYDILMKEELDEFAQDSRCKIHYAIDKASKSWKGFEGYVSKEMIKKTMPAPGPNVLICICGRREMNKLVKNLLLECGYDEANIYKF